MIQKMKIMIYQIIENSNDYLDNEFCNLNRYNNHNNYLQNRDDTKQSEDISSELNDNLFMDEFDRFYSGNIINNNQ